MYGYEVFTVTKNEREEKAEKWVTTNFNNASWNFKSLECCYYFVDSNQFRLISTSKMAKEAWDILQVAHEVTSIMKVIQASNAQP